MSAPTTAAMCRVCGRPRDALFGGCDGDHLAGFIDGLARRDTGTALVLDAPAQDVWRADAWEWLTTLMPGRHITSTDLIDAVGMPPSPNAVGALMRSAATRRLIAPTGRYVSSPRPTCHAAVVQVWETR
jgi:hypothetical protein